MVLYLKVKPLNAKNASAFPTGFNKVKIKFKMPTDIELFENLHDELFREIVYDYIFLERKVFETGIFHIKNESYSIIRISPTILLLNNKRKKIKIKCGLEYIIDNCQCILSYFFLP